MSIDLESYSKWKASIPLLYDWFAHHSLTWPSLTCRWGPVLSETSFKRKQRLYYAEQTDLSEPQKLTIASVDACKARVASGESINSWSDTEKCPHVTVDKQIIHPGEVNKVRECPLYPEILVTHTDSPHLYVWNVARQLNSSRRVLDHGRANVADLILTGHQHMAEYALGMSRLSPLVASGGHDHKVLVWNLEDHITSLATREAAAPSSSPKLSAQVFLTGHEETVEDLVFKPDSSHELASVGNDYKLLFWDTRSHTLPVAAVRSFSDCDSLQSDVHCVDWNSSGHLIATGSADGVLKVWDRRRMTTAEACAFSFSFHKKAVMRVEWDPFNEVPDRGGGEDAVMCIWDLYQSRVKSTEVQENKRARRFVPSELLFQHNGHKCIIVDFQWNPTDPWTLLSVSDDVGLDRGGGSLQLWRVSDLIYRPEHEVLQELQQHARWIVSGKYDGSCDPAKRMTNGQLADSTSESGNAPMEIEPSSSVNDAVQNGQPRGRQN